MIVKDLKNLNSKFIADENPKLEKRFTHKNKTRYLELEKQTMINSTKNTLLLLFIPIIFALLFVFREIFFTNYDISLLQIPFNYENINISTLIVLIIIAAITVHVVALISHLMVFNSLNIDDTPKFIWNVFWNFQKENKNLPIFFFSPDLFYAKWFKYRIIESIKESSFNEDHTFTDKESLSMKHWNSIRIELKSFIEKSNWLNVILTIAISILFIFITEYVNNIFSIELILSIVIVRILSRGIEISIAFYKDVVRVDAKLFVLIDNKIPISSVYINGFQSSLLRQSSRLSLAIHTLIELIIIFALGYYLFFNILVNLPSEFLYINSCERYYVVPSYLEMLLFSSTLGIFNISFGAYQNIILSILHCAQVLISALIILVSIAQYISADKSLKPEEETFYRNINLVHRRDNQGDIVYPDCNDDTFLK